MNDQELDNLLRHEVMQRVDAAPEARKFADLADLEHQTATRVWPVDEPGRRLWLAAASAAFVVLLGGAWWSLQHNKQIDVTSTGVSVLHEVISYEQTLDLSCPNQEITGDFDEMTVEVWGSPELGRWRRETTYPDGSTATLILTGSPYYPIDSVIDGANRGRNIVCTDLGIWWGAVNGDALGSLNPMAPSPLAPGGGRAVLSFSDLGERVPGEFRTSDGTPAELWRAVTEGTQSSGGSVGQVVQIDEWFVERGTSKVLERTFRQEVEGLGKIVTRSRLLESGSVTVPIDFFESDLLPAIDQNSTETRRAAPANIDVDPLTELGSASIWPAEPREESPLELASRFADFLGWVGAGVTTDEDGSGPAWVTIDAGDGRSVRTLTIPSPQGQVIIAITPLQITAQLTSGERIELNTSLPDTVGSVDVYVDDGEQTQAWTVNGPSKGQIIVPFWIANVDAVLLLGRNSNGDVVAVAGSDFRQ